MNSNERLNQIQARAEQFANVDDDDALALVNALRAVLAVHRKATLYPADGDGIVDLEAAPLMDYCEECTPSDTTESIDDACWQDGMETIRYPCDTVRAVESALGGAS